MPMTRAELTTVLSLFFQLVGGSHPFSDIEGHWAQRYIVSAFNNGWVAGYPDGTFRPDNPITRAETVTIINHALNRRPNPETINYHITHYIFVDLTRNHWAFYQIMEATVRHDFVRDDDYNEIWIYVFLQ